MEEGCNTLLSHSTEPAWRFTMQSILPWLGVLVLIVSGWAVVKKYQVNMVLFLGGLVLNILALMGGMDSLMAKGSTGFVGFDLIALLHQISTSQIAGVGFIILVSGGFAPTCRRSALRTAS